jgi:hypothetical protein
MGEGTEQVEEEATVVIGSTMATMGEVVVTRCPRAGDRESWISAMS